MNGSLDDLSSAIEEPSFASQNSNIEARRTAWKEALDRLAINCKLPDLLRICREREWSDVGVKPLFELSSDLASANLFLKGEDLNENSKKGEVVDAWNEYIDSGEMDREMRSAQGLIFLSKSQTTSEFVKKPDRILNSSSQMARRWGALYRAHKLEKAKGTNNLSKHVQNKETDESIANLAALARLFQNIDFSP